MEDTLVNAAVAGVSAAQSGIDPTIDPATGRSVVSYVCGMTPRFAAVTMDNGIYSTDIPRHFLFTPDNVDGLGLTEFLPRNFRAKSASM